MVVDLFVAVILLVTGLQYGVFDSREACEAAVAEAKAHPAIIAVTDCQAVQLRGVVEEEEEKA